MTVKELIESLQRLNADLPVCVYLDQGTDAVGLVRSVRVWPICKMESTDLSAPVVSKFVVLDYNE